MPQQSFTWSALEPQSGGLFQHSRRVVGKGEYRSLTFHEVESKSLINRVPESSQVPFRYTINPYRGCSHACTYCFARPTHEYLGFDIGHDFDSQIVVKTNAVALARAETVPGRWAGHRIAMGTNTDPYQKAEGRYRLTRGIVEVLTERRNPFSILTKVDPDTTGPRPVCRSCRRHIDLGRLLDRNPRRERVARDGAGNSASPAALGSGEAAQRSWCPERDPRSTPAPLTQRRGRPGCSTDQSGGGGGRHVRDPDGVVPHPADEAPLDDMVEAASARAGRTLCGAVPGSGPVAAGIDRGPQRLGQTERGVSACRRHRAAVGAVRPRNMTFGLGCGGRSR